MPLREDDNGRLVEAFYPPTWVRLGKPGERVLPAVEPFLLGSEGTRELTLFYNRIIQLMTKHYDSKGIGKRDIQVVLDWMSTVAQRLNMPTTGLFCRAHIRGEVIVPRGISNEEDLQARYVCQTGENWYRKEHGNGMDHLVIVNALTLSFRL